MPCDAFEPIRLPDRLIGWEQGGVPCKPSGIGWTTIPSHSQCS